MQIEKASNTELKITTSQEVIVSVVDIKARRDQAQGIVDRIEERRAIPVLDLETEYQAALATIAECDVLLQRAIELNVE